MTGRQPLAPASVWNSIHGVFVRVLGVDALAFGEDEGAAGDAHGLLGEAHQIHLDAAGLRVLDRIMREAGEVEIGRRARD